MSITDEQRTLLQQDIHRNGDRPTASAWPKPLGTAAYHGLAGEIVRKIEPESEADPSALMVQFMVATGIACGRNPYFTVEATRHGLNEFAVVVGDTSKGRKGTGYDRVIQPIAMADESFGLRCVSGLSSGEGLIWEVRDQRTIRRKAKKSEESQADEEGYVTEVEDEGVLDKRLLVYESELASVLAVLERSGNTLASKLRDAWDGRDLSVKAKNSPLAATGPHIGIVAHITAEELRRRLTGTDAASGYGNRHLWVCSKRSKLLPRGGKPISWGPLVNELAAAIGGAKQLGEIDFNAEAGELWDAEYARLSAGGVGLSGAVASRAEAHTRRLATIYAVLDHLREVQVAHLRAALEIWRYCEDSCRFLFGGRTGNPIADTILSTLCREPKGITRTAIRDLFGRNVGGNEIDLALTELVSRGLAYMENEETGGRPAERWFAVLEGESR
ncbi:MAG: hypothetical protein AABM42_10030 [Actinomycetota bacterium]